ncbi:MAG TPA: hypothetical protein VJ385_02640 [Fibrobacteria bacterium]|nr:hypothetical protein [Fibrobacteria bacterium]
MFRVLTTAAMLALAQLPAPGQTPTPVRSAGEPMTDAKLAAIPSFVLPDKYKDRTRYPLPASADNSKQPFFPPIGTWEQQGNSCANAQTVSVIYGYEAQRALNTPSSGDSPAYTYEYAYHFLNGGDALDGGDGWMFVEAMDLLKQTGAATSADFGGLEWGNKFNGWMSGYDKYYRAMKVRASEYYKIDISNAAGDELVKQYLVDHGDGSPIGGNLVVQVRFQNVTRTTVNGKPVISAFQKNTPLNHAFAICGYDNAFNGGSWLIHNTHGDGLYWVPYNLFRAGGPIATAQGTPVLFCRVRRDYAPKYTLKITLTHNQRGNIAVMTGFAASAAATVPAVTKDYAGAFNYSGGLFPMGGRAQSSTLEFGLDVTDFAPAPVGGNARFFLHVISKGGTGRIDRVSLMDYTGAAVREIPAAETNKTIAPNAVTTISIPLGGSSGVPRDGTGAGRPPGPYLWGSRKDGSMRIPLPGPASGPVILAIRDFRGSTVFARELDPGPAGAPAEFPWKMEDDRGGRAAPGLYFATVEPARGGKRTGAALPIRIAE